MNKNILFNRTTNFTGRNGFFKQSGLNVYYPLVPSTLSVEHEVTLTPITSKGKEGNCAITIPSENIGDVVAVLSAITAVPVISKHRFYIVGILERNGEQEYYQQKLLKVGARTKKSAETLADEVARKWYDDKATLEDGWYSFFGGCIAVRVRSCEEISERDFLTLLKYI